MVKILVFALFSIHFRFFHFSTSIKKFIHYTIYNLSSNSYNLNETQIIDLFFSCFIFLIYDKNVSSSSNSDSRSVYSPHHYSGVDSGFITPQNKSQYQDTLLQRPTKSWIGEGSHFRKSARYPPPASAEPNFLNSALRPLTKGLSP